MNGWSFVLGIGGAILLWLIVKWFFISPAENEFDEWARECMNKQAGKRNGKVTVTNRMPALTTQYKTVNIDLAFISNDNELDREQTYARFRTEHFPDKEFKILLNSKDFFLKPLAVGTRVELLDERLSEKYVVTGNDAIFLNRLLTQELRDKLLKESLHVMFGRRTDSSRLNRERGWLTVFTQGMKADDEVFDGLIETAILFSERFEALSKSESP